MKKLTVGLGCLILVMSAHAVITYDDFNDGIINPEWNLLQSGWSTEAGGELRIQGTTTLSEWMGYGISSSAGFGEGSFDVSVDFSLPQFSGFAHKLVYLGAKGSASDETGLFYSHPYGYRVQTWTPSLFSTWLDPFGDETNAFHRMRLVYDADTEILEGYVDDFYVGALSIQIAGDVTFSLRAVTSDAGMDIDVRYDHFQAIPEPSSLAMIGLVSGCAVFIRRRFMI